MALRAPFTRSRGPFPAAAYLTAVLPVVLVVVIWGLAITAFGLATFFFPVALIFLAIAGAADVLSAVFRSTVVQLATPDSLRGRVTALHILAVTSGPRIGDIEAAAVAAVVGAQASVVSGGILCLLGAAAVTRLFPELGAHVVQSPTAVVDGAGNEEPA